ncbi:ras guanine nucleotide exchange factor domain-containing protein [Lentinula aciculospora]|uniref:Ras guanine nucleotide exchange factor domain-containing protein n=1 Tax=Lentinula aciculospora TaxID=153920 RepID=A0A9W9AGK2_9AGAR|nr:ras guanine nucleotide exchange factor domain-containing protein [Lentinula aciculospora]
MYASHLKIDTSVSSLPGPFSVGSSASPLASYLGVSQSHANRMRTTSNASSASSLSVLSPLASSSTNASVTSLVHGEALSPTSRSASPSVNESISIIPEYVLAMHDYEPQHDVSTCLSFRAGQVIHVLDRDASGWWNGELEGKRGWFPSNYVNTGMNPLVEADIVHPYHKQSRSYSASQSQLVQLASVNSNIESHVPPVMVPLLHGLSLLQSAARSNRISHFQPSTACIISCVRSVLSATDTLLRDAPILRKFPALADERRLILSTLASLVAQAKRASDGKLNEENLETEVEAMLRLAQQVFSLVRRFLAIAFQCGIELPARRDSSAVVNVRVLRDADINSVDDSNDTIIVQNTPSLPPGRTPTKPRVKGRPGTPGGAARAKSMSDLRGRAKAKAGVAPVVPPLPSIRSVSAQHQLDGSRHKAGESSVSSTTSTSTTSSLGSMATPSLPPFPCGPCTMAQVLQALRATHDHYLSAVAAFVGHAHSHSRFSHASSMGHMYDLVREIVEMSCKLLTIVEAVLQHPDVPNHRLESLRAAKDQLYSVTSELAESVRLLTMPLPQAMSDDEEKTILLRSATAALKAGGDLVFSVKVCLNRSLGERPFIINVPHLGEPGSAEAFRTASYPSSQVVLSSNQSPIMSDHGDHGVDEEDVTIQPHKFPQIRPEASSGSESSSIGSISKTSSVRSGETVVTVPDEPKTLAPLVISKAIVDPALCSPTSLARTDDDGTTWEGSTRNHPLSLEEKIIYGELPTVPSEPTAPIPLSLPNSAGYMFSHDYAVEDIAYNSDGVLVGATLAVLVEKLTPHDSIVDSAFSAVFFMTFRLFSTPIEVGAALISRYNLVPPMGLPHEDVLVWKQRKGLAVRLRVSNFIKLWLDLYWRPTPDDSALPMLEAFTRDGLMTMFPGPAERILDMIYRRKEQEDSGFSPKGDRSRDPGMSLNPPSAPPPSEIPRPLMTKTLLTALRSRNFAVISITDFDPLELARQMTIMESRLYGQIMPEEILESGQDGAKPPVNVKEMSSLSTAVTGWVAESILNERDTKKRTALIKFFIKVADRCVGLHNYSTFRSLLAALDSSTISRLRQTWMGLPQKTKLQLESLRRLADHGRNYHEYRTKLRNTAPPAVPFLGLYLTDVTFCREGNPSHRNSPLNPDKKLLNFNKYHKLARIVQDMQRFQVPYHLKDIPEAQEYLAQVFQASQRKGDLQDLYRRSLLVEPKQPADAPPSGPSGDMRQLFTWASRTQTQAVSQA